MSWLETPIYKIKHGTGNNLSHFHSYQIQERQEGIGHVKGEEQEG